MERIVLVLTLVAFSGASAASPQWQSYDEAIRTAKNTNEQVLVLYGSDYCPEVPPALTAFESPAVADVTKGKVSLAYVDIASKNGGRVAKRYHVLGTPTLQVLSASAKETWRLSSPRTSDALIAALHEVLDGKSYLRQERLLNEGTLDPESTLDLAMTYLDQGATQKGRALVRRITGDPTHFSPELRQKATYSLVDNAPAGKKRFRMLQEYLQVYPDDFLALLNYGYQLRHASIEKRRAAIQRVAAGLDTAPSDLKEDGLRLIVQFVAYDDPTSATWALPYALQRVRLDPENLNNLSEATAVAMLANQPDQIDAAKQLVAAKAPADKIGDAVAEGMKLAAKATPLASARQQ